ncbi:hypothetical protein AGMMS50229_07190 [Campylobacterota bacterium]|nr:hypothetical protein AGMMS50229_07190 [Campylobacterota bacterium]
MSIALVLTWKTWPHENIVEMEKEFVRNGRVKEGWTVVSTQQVYVGIPFVAYSQHKIGRNGGRGIFGIGTITALKYAGGGYEADFTMFCDPWEKPLLDDVQCRLIWGNRIFQSSGQTIPQEQYEAIIKAIENQQGKRK